MFVVLLYVQRQDVSDGAHCVRQFHWRRIHAAFVWTSSGCLVPIRRDRARQVWYVLLHSYVRQFSVFLLLLLSYLFVLLDVALLCTSMCIKKNIHTWYWWCIYFWLVATSENVFLHITWYFPKYDTPTPWTLQLQIFVLLIRIRTVYIPCMRPYKTVVCETEVPHTACKYECWRNPRSRGCCFSI